MRFSFRYFAQKLPRLASCAAVLGLASAQAATYYVDRIAGVDTNAGTSPALPWKNALRTDASLGRGSRAPGDRVHFTNGGIWTFRIYSATTLESPELEAARSPSEQSYEADGYCLDQC
jgi:hypothetical protein